MSRCVIASNRGRPRRLSRSGSRQRASGGQRRKWTRATRSSKSSAFSCVAAQRVQAGDVVARERIVGALGDARVEALERAIEVPRRFFRLPHAMVGGADLHR